MSDMSVYGVALLIGFASLVAGVYVVGGVGAALITLGCGLLATGLLGIRNNAQDAG